MNSSIPRTMKALVKAQPKEGLWLQEIPVPEISHNDVLIKILKTAICGTDIHIYNWDQWAQKNIPVPMHIGHEFVGQVVAMGSHVKDCKPGDLVSGEGHIICGHCRNCLAGRRHLCRATKGVGVNRPGAFAQYLSIPITNVWFCDKKIPLDVLTCFDPLGNAVHTALTFDVLGEDVLITGAGPIGCMAAAIARHAGARNIVVTDINPFRLGLAQKAGATRTVNPKHENLSEIQKELGMKEGFDVAMEMSGSPDAFDCILDNMFHGGKIALLGILPDQTAMDWNKIVFSMLTIKGIYGRQMFETWYKMTAMVQSGLDISSLITHRFHYTDFQKGFDVMRSGQSGKVILDWD